MKINRKVMQYRNRAAKRWSNFDFLSKDISDSLANMILMLKRDFKVCLLIGGHDGHIIDVIRPKCKTIIATDMSHEFLKLIDNKADFRFVSDMENMPIELNSVDLVISFLNLHTIDKVNHYLFKLNALLKPDGVIFGAHYGNAAMNYIGDYINRLEAAGKSAHPRPHRVISTIGAVDIANMLQLVGDYSTVAVKHVTIKYAGCYKMIQDIRGMGESLYKCNPVISKAVAKKILTDREEHIVRLGVALFMVGKMKAPERLLG